MSTKRYVTKKAAKHAAKKTSKKASKKRPLHVSPRPEARFKQLKTRTRERTIPPNK